MKNSTTIAQQQSPLPFLCHKTIAQFSDSAELLWWRIIEVKILNMIVACLVMNRQPYCLTDYTQDEKALKGTCDCTQGMVKSPHTFMLFDLS